MENKDTKAPLSNQFIDKEKYNSMKEKGLMTIKASNELLDEAKESVLSTDKLDEDEKKERIKQIEEAQGENMIKAKNLYGANNEDLKNIAYNKVKDEYVKKYNERLAKRGLTDEIVREKSVATTETKKEIPVRRHMTRKAKREMEMRKKAEEEYGVDEEAMKSEDIEKELMESSMIKSDEDLKKKNEDEKKKNNDMVKKAMSKDGNIEDDKKNEDAKTTAKANTHSKNDFKGSLRVLNPSDDKSTVLDRKLPLGAKTGSSKAQYDMIPLPSKGECYKGKKKKARIAVSFLTASDENLIASPHLYEEGILGDSILERKIMDDDIKASDLCEGDRDAIILWLRATAYGYNVPINAVNPNDTTKRYDIDVDLSEFEYLPFNLKGDENGWFDYKCSNGDIIKFRFLTKTDRDNLKEELKREMTNVEKYNVLKYVSSLRESIKNRGLNKNDLDEVNECIDDIIEINGQDKLDVDINKVGNFITMEMKQYTMSVNGNEDREFISNYIDNMRAFDAIKYRRFVSDNVPGVDFEITVNIPEKDGGGSFNTFLSIDDSILFMV